MTGNPQPYPAYRPSGVPWLGDIPAHWEVQRGKALLAPIDIRSTTGDEELLTVSAQHGVTPRETASVTMFKAESYVGYKLCWPGDLVINSLWAWAYGLGVSRHHGIVSSAYGVYRPLTRSNSRFIHLLVRSIPFQWELQVRSKGIWVSRLQLTDEAFLAAPFPLPPPEEQAAIVRYLDLADERIARYVSVKQRLIDLLEEQHQAVIHQAVTRGLNPNAPLKPSGVPRLGDMPAHWEVRRLKHWVGINELVLPETTASGFEFRYLEISAVGTGKLVEEPSRIRFATAPSRARRIVSDGDTVISTVRTYLKAVWFAEEANGDLICSTGFAVLTPKRETIPGFVGYVVQSDGFTDQVSTESVGIAYPAIAESQLGRLQVCVPPPDEQAAIAAHLDQATAETDAAIARARRQIELMQEYRTRLIADVVTGKMDVRAVDAR